MVFTEGLTEFQSNSAGLVAISNLRGFVCPSCPERHYDGPSYEAIRMATERGPKPFTAHAKASKLARGAVGIYFPRDVKAYNDIEAGDDVEFQPIAPGLMLLRITSKSATEQAT